MCTYNIFLYHSDIKIYNNCRVEAQNLPNGKKQNFTRQIKNCKIFACLNLNEKKTVPNPYQTIMKRRKQN